MRALIAALTGLVVSACATVPEPEDRACLVTTAVLTPILNAAHESGDATELASHTTLWPVRQDEAWTYVQRMGFAPVWRTGSTEAALRRAYWEAFLPLQAERALSSAEREFQAWEAAYQAVGDDRVFVDDGLWQTFFTGNQRSAQTACATDWADRTGAHMVSLQHPRADKAVRVEPSRPVFNAGGTAP